MTKHYLLMLVLIGTFAVAQKQSISIQASGNNSNKDNVESVKDESPSNYQDSEIEGFRLFPNPVTDGTVFIITKKNNLKDILIYNVLGKVVLQKKVSATYLNVSNLNSGVYILKVTEDNKTTTRKLVIK